MNYNEVRDRLAFALYYSDYVWEHDLRYPVGPREVECALRMWNGYIKSINKEPWAYGEHAGDCTKEPMACFRCLVEEFYEDADKILNIEYSDIEKENKIRTIKGDLIRLTKNNKFDVVVHGCNCFCTMGAGVAKLIKMEFPEAFIADCQTRKGDKRKLGDITCATINISGRPVIIVNGYTQYNYKGKQPLADYEAIRSVFNKIKKLFSGMRIGFPKIGAGLAGGDWCVIGKIIHEELVGEDFTLVEFKP